MEIVIIFVFLILSIGFFYFIRKYCKNLNKTNDETLLDDYDELDDELDLEANTKPSNTELAQINYISKSTDECSICLETLKNKEITQFECLHKYHKECINDWINRRNNNINCPECGI